MKNKELVTELAARMGWTAQEVAETLSVLSSVVSSRLVKKKAERISVNPSNGKRYLVPPKLVPVFKPGTTVKNKLKELGDHE